MTEKDVIDAVVNYLKEDGWTIIKTAYGHVHGVDIEAQRGGVIRKIEAKGNSKNEYIDFYTAIGQIISRMAVDANVNGEYSIAFPASGRFYDLWSKIHLLVGQKLGLTALCISPNGVVKILP